MNIISCKPAWIYELEINKCFQELTKIYWYAIKYNIDVLDCKDQNSYKKKLKLKKIFNLIKEKIKYPDKKSNNFNLEDDEFDEDICRELYNHIHPNDKKYRFYPILAIYDKNLEKIYNIAWLYDF
jgi:hypothetical protein